MSQLWLRAAQSFFPTLLLFPLAYLWQWADYTLKFYQVRSSMSDRVCDAETSPSRMSRSQKEANGQKTVC